MDFGTGAVKVTRHDVNIMKWESAMISKLSISLMKMPLLIIMSGRIQRHDALKLGRKLLPSWRIWSLEKTEDYRTGRIFRRGGVPIETLSLVQWFMKWMSLLNPLSMLSNMVISNFILNIGLKLMITGWITLRTGAFHVSLWWGHRFQYGIIKLLMKFIAMLLLHRYWKLEIRMKTSWTMVVKLALGVWCIQKWKRTELLLSNRCSGYSSRYYFFLGCPNDNGWNAF